MSRAYSAAEIAANAACPEDRVRWLAATGLIRPGRSRADHVRGLALALVVGLWSRSFRASIPLGLLAVATPVLVELVQDPSEIAVAIWVLGIVFPWVMGRPLPARSSS